MASLSGGVGDVYTLNLTHHATVTTSDDTSGTTYKVPFKGKVIAALGTVEALGGGTNFTDVAFVIKNGTQSSTIVTLNPVASSAIVSGGDIDRTLDAAVAEDDVLEMEIDITGGAGSPTVAGMNCQLWIVRT